MDCSWRRRQLGSGRAPNAFAAVTDLHVAKVRMRRPAYALSQSSWLSTQRTRRFSPPARLWIRRFQVRNLEGQLRSRLIVSTEPRRLPGLCAAIHPAAHRKHTAKNRLARVIGRVRGDRFNLTAERSPAAARTQRRAVARPRCHRARWASPAPATTAPALPPVARSGTGSAPQRRGRGGNVLRSR